MPVESKRWRVLVIEDNVNLSRDAKREIDDSFGADDEIAVEVIIENDFDNGYARIAAGECDIVVLDVRRDAVAATAEDLEAGRGVFQGVRNIRFLPVIFWTAAPQHVEDEVTPPLVVVLSKEDLDKVPDAIRAAIDSQAVEIMAEIELTVSKTMREHMWDELAPNWTEYAEDGMSASIAKILIARVAQVLQDQGDTELTARPSHRYLYPPVSPSHGPGDLLREGDHWYSILTPACDLEQDKVEFVLLARAMPLSEHPKYVAWESSSPRSASKWGDVANVLKGRIPRYYYLPAFRDIPELVLDLEDVRSVRKGVLSGYSHVASLVSPYSEALLVQHSHFRGRVGVPDIDLALVKERIEALALPPRLDDDSTAA
ncbi:hypothetical protein ACEXQB_012280 [Herbiconiux sp. P18]|uniref:hypothetical protein n=1 Tax=Herbiconiux liangxiaofengii TaxID=3342795 RepID=UPI0035BB41D5